MNYFFKTFLLLSLISSSLSECSKGCLKCNSQNKCLLCDSLNKYKIDGDRCILFALENCIQMSHSGKCVQCDSGHSLDFNVHKCVMVQRPILNCLYYSSEERCSICETNFYISEGKCSAVMKLIPGCKFYLTSSDCLVCENQMVLSQNLKSCNPQYEDPDCQAFSYYECQTCQQDYLYNHNVYFKKLFGFETPTQIQQLEFIQNKIGNNERFLFKKNICHQKSDLNCSIYDDQLGCKQCNLNYFLGADARCHQYPREEIKNCESYASAQICQNCVNGYYLQSSNKCTPVTLIINCKTYQTDAYQSACKECEDGFFNSENTCKKRVNSKEIEFCEKPEVSEDSCGKCAEGKQLTSDKLKCLPAIALCATYEEGSTKNDSELVCEKCVERHFLLHKQCVLGSVKNCLQFLMSENKCQKCVSQFFLNDGNCVAHTASSDCKEFSSSVLNECEVCHEGFQKVQMLNQCSLSEVINNCLVYKNATTCETCEPYHFLSNDNCQLIPEHLNCLEFDGSICRKCKNLFVLHQGKCHSVPRVIENNCLEISSSEQSLTLARMQCDVCKESSFPVEFKNSFVCLEKSFLQTEIQNCLQYDSSGKCHLCAEDFYLLENSCVEQCQGSIMKYEFSQNKETQKFFLNKLNQCLPQIDNCRSLSQNFDSKELQRTCSLCKAQFLTVPNDKRTKSALFDSKLDVVESPVNFVNGVDCLDVEDKQILGEKDSEKMIENCEFYYLLNESNSYGCLKCRHGFQGVISTDESVQKHFINRCVQFQECDVNVNSPGLSIFVQKFSSCHQCLNKEQIPFSAVFSPDNKAFNQLKAFNLSSSTWTEVEGGKSNICLPPVSESFQISSKSFALPKNCAQGLINVSKDKIALSNQTKEQGGDLEKMSVFCVACQKGFKPVYFELGSIIVVECLQIQNCDNSDWWNYCHECNQKYQHSFDKSFGLIYNQCFPQISDLNCSIRISDEEKCHTCVSGHLANLDGLCEPFIPGLCLDQSASKHTEHELNALALVLSQKNKLRGCLKCEDQYISQLQTSSKNICVYSTYLEKKEFLQKTQLTQFCQHYAKKEERIYCHQCQTGFVVDSDNKICFPNTEIQFCQTASTAQVCNKCLQGYVSIKGKCIKTSLSNCLEYDEAPSNNQQKCSKCESGYFLAENRCKKGAISGCLNYESNKENICAQCLPKHYLQRKENYSYCFPLQIDLNCEEISENFQKNQFECKKCSPKYHVNSDPQVQSSKCLSFHKILNCIEYEQAEESMRYSCKQCAEAYYSSNHQCIQRTYLNEEAVSKYDLQGDRASECKTNFFLDWDLKCKKNPNGIQGCVRYKDEKTCIGCKAHQFLTNNACHDVPLSSKKDFCLYYQTQNECIGCEEGYYPENGACVRALALDCNSYESIRSCASCKPGYGLKVLGDARSCVLVNRPYCHVFSSIFPWECLACQKNFYPDQFGGCSEVKTPIEDCLAYESEFRCKRCSQGMILSERGDLCIVEGQDFLDEKCLSYVKLDRPTCSLCKAGFLFEGNKCKSCGERLQEGCFTCNPFNEKECLMCKSGYYQEKNGNCKAIVVDGESQNEKEESKWTSQGFFFLQIFVLLFN